MTRLYYEDLLIGELLTNFSITVDDAIELLGIDMDDWAYKQGWDNWDPECLWLSNGGYDLDEQEIEEYHYELDRLRRQYGIELCINPSLYATEESLLILSEVLKKAEIYVLLNKTRIFRGYIEKMDSYEF